MTAEPQKEYIIEESELKKILEVLTDEGCKGLAGVCETRIRSRPHSSAKGEAVLDDLLEWCSGNWTGAIIRPCGEERVVDVLDYQRTVEKILELREQTVRTPETCKFDECCPTGYCPPCSAEGECAVVSRQRSMGDDRI